MQVISSKENDLVKHIKKLKDKKYRDESNEYIVEGVKLIEEAVKENAKIKKIVLNVNGIMKFLKIGLSKPNQHLMERRKHGMSLLLWMF